jgi:hypothetical protein
MAEPSDYHRGDMDISEHTSTFNGFIALSKWGSLTIAVALLFLVMMFCAHAGLFQAALAAIVVAAVGGFILRDKPDSGH